MEGPRVSYHGVSDKIHDSAHRILENLQTLDEMTQNQSYSIPAESELNEIRKYFDDLQLDNKDAAMKELVKWMRLRSQYYSENDEDLIKGIENFHRSFSDSITMTLQTMFKDMECYDSKLHGAFEDVNALSVKLEEFYANTHSHETEDIRFPDLVLADKQVEGQLSTYSRETLIEQLVQMQMREKYFLEILESMRMQMKRVQQDIEAYSEKENQLKDSIKKHKEDLNQKIEIIKKLEDNVTMYQIKEEVHIKSLERMDVFPQEYIEITHMPKKNELLISDFIKYEIIDVSSLNNFTVENNSFDVVCETIIDKNNKEIQIIIQKETDKLSDQIQQMQENIQDLIIENEELRSKLDGNGSVENIHEPTNAYSLSRKSSTNSIASIRRDNSLSNVSDNRVQSGRGSRSSAVFSQDIVEPSNLKNGVNFGENETETVFNSGSLRTSGYVTPTGQLMVVDTVVSNVVELHKPAILMPDETTRSPRHNFSKSSDSHSRQGSDPSFLNSGDDEGTCQASSSSSSNAGYMNSNLVSDNTFTGSSNATKKATFNLSNEANERYLQTNQPSSEEYNTIKSNVNSNGTSVSSRGGKVNFNDPDSVTMSFRPFEAEDARDALKAETSIDNEKRPATVHGNYNKPLVHFPGETECNEGLTTTPRSSVRNGKNGNDILVDGKLPMGRFGQRFARTVYVRKGRPIYSQSYLERMERLAAFRKGINPRFGRTRFSIVTASDRTHPTMRGAELLRITPLPTLRPRVMGSTNPNEDLNLMVAPVRVYR